jgi:hypothetical protein
MAQDMVTLSVQGNEEGVKEIKTALEKNPQNVVETAEILAQAGDPNTWVVAGEILKDVVPLIVPIIAGLFARHHIGKVEIKEPDGETMVITDGNAQDIEKLQKFLKPKAPNKGAG